MRPFWILIILLLVAAAAGGYYGASWPGFRVKQITVSGNDVVSKADIVHRAAIDGTQNIWLQNMRSAAQRIEALPYVADARIHRTLPALVRITITERKPFAIVRSPGQIILVDEQLRVLELDGVRPDLPVFNSPIPLSRPGAFLHDQRLSAMVRDFRTMQAAHVDAASLSFGRLGDLSVVLPTGIVIELGDDADLNQKAALVDPILSQTQTRGRRVRSLDLRAPKTPVVVFRQ